MKHKLKNRATQALAIFFLVAGINHFVLPDFYYPLIPDYLPYPVAINAISGVLEIVFGLGLLFPKTRSLSAWGIITLLVLFIPSHIHFIVIGSCVEDGLCVHPVIGWLRLLVIHPLLIFWAVRCRK